MSYNKFRNGYKEREKEKYDEWRGEISETKFPIYIMSGSQFWIKETIDGMSKSLGKRPEHVRENLKIYTDKMRYKSISRKKHFVLFESKGSTLKESDFLTLRSYFADPSDNGILFIVLKDRSDKSYFLKNFRMIKKSNKIKFFDMDYVSDHFKELYVWLKLDNYDFEFENEKLKQDTIKNLILNMDELEDNLMTLHSLETPILSKDDIKNSIEEYSDSNLHKLYDSLTKLNRKKIPYQIINDMFSEGLNSLQLLRGIRRHFIFLYQAKYLKMRGILRANDIEEEKIEIYKDEGLIFNNPDIWEISKRKRNQYLNDCDEITIKEILQVLNIIENYVQKVRIRKGEKYIYNEYIDKPLFMSCIIEIMNRRSEY